MHVFERGRAAVVHVGRRDGDVAERRRLELADVFRLPGDLVDPGIRRRIRQRAGEVVQTGVVKLDVSFAAPFEVHASGHREPAMTAEARQRLAEEQRFAAAGGRGDGGVVALGVIAIVGRSRGNDRALERGQRLRDVLERERIRLGAKGPLEQRPVRGLAAAAGRAARRPACCRPSSIGCSPNIGTSA